MPQLHINLPQGLLENLDDLRFTLRFKSRTALVCQLLQLFAPDLDCLALAQFVHRYYPHKVDELMAAMVREGEAVRQ